MGIQKIRERQSTPAEFFERDVPDLHRELRPIFSKLSDVPVRFHIDFAALDCAYTVELRNDGARVTEGEMIDFPIVTLRTSVTEWEVVREHTFELLELGADLFEQRVDTGRLTTLDDDILDRFERFDGVIELALSVPEVPHPLESELILNAYAPFGDPQRFELGLDVGALYRAVRGESSPAEVVRSGELRGEMSLAFNLSGFLLNAFPELSE